MNWLKRHLRNWVNNDGDSDIQSNKSKRSRGLVIANDSESFSTEPLRLSIYIANGGTVVETRTYDRLKDRSQNQLYVINDGEDLGEQLSKIITITSLGR
jgi:hypothetical protein